MLVTHHFLGSPYTIPNTTSDLYQYLVASNGVFVNAYRPGLYARIPHASTPPIRGLDRIDPLVDVEHRVPRNQLARLFEMAYRSAPREILFYLTQRDFGYQITLPNQVQRFASVRPVDPYSSAGANALIEVHSHHSMGAFFSRQDNIDEANGFRIYAVIGWKQNQPEIVCRVGIYGHFYQIPAHRVFDLPTGVLDIEEQREFDEAHLLTEDEKAGISKEFYDATVGPKF